MDAAALSAQLVERIDADALRAAAARLDPPAEQAEHAAKGLRKLCEHTENAALRESTVGALCESCGARSALCAAISAATAAIDGIDARADADTAACGLLRWGHMRVNCLAVLMQMACSEARCVALLGEDGAPAAAAANLLLSPGARTDLEGVRLAVNLLRNLAMPAANKRAVGAVGAAEALLAHVGHRDPNVASLVGATLRLLVDGCAPNACELAARYFARAGADADARQSAAGPFGALINLDLTKLHPFGRAELARFVCITVSACCRPPAESAPSESPHLPLATQLALSAPAALEFGAFGLTSRHAQLHREVCDALNAAHGVHVAAGAADDAAGAWRAMRLSAGGEAIPLLELLRRCVSAGTLRADECAALLQCAS